MACSSVSTDFLDERIKPFLEPPWTDADDRVFVLEVGQINQDRLDFLTVNPWLESFPPGSSIFSDLEKLSILGVPISVAQAIKRGLPHCLHKVALDILSRLVDHSSCACDQLVKVKLLPLRFPTRWDCLPELQGLVRQIEQMCKKTAYSGELGADSDGWLGWPSAYDLCLKTSPSDIKWIRLNGAHKSHSLFDLSGIHLTGGRLWAGSIILARWVASLHLSTPELLGNGLVLELGAGVGLSGVVLAKLGRKVVLSDREPALLEALEENVRINQVEDRCRVLRLDWADVRKPNVRKFLKRQRISAVIGSDLAYEKCHAQLLVGVLTCSLAAGGTALIVQAKHHRYCQDQLGEELSAAGLRCEERTVPVTGLLQSKFCGTWEPQQEYVLYTVAVPALPE